MKKLLLIISSLLILQNCGKNEFQNFTKNLGESNKLKLDEFILGMESKLSEIYKQKTITLNYQKFLKDFTNEVSLQKINFNQLDFEYLANFEKSELEDQYDFFQYDSVYYDSTSYEYGIIMIDKNGNKEVEVFPPDWFTKKEIIEEVEKVKKIGYGELIQKGILYKILKENKSKNLQLEQYFQKKYTCSYTSKDELTKSFLQINPNFENIFIKSIVLYDLYVPLIRQRKFENKN